jgi:hypothetical protein
MILSVRGAPEVVVAEAADRESLLDLVVIPKGTVVRLTELQLHHQAHGSLRAPLPQPTYHRFASSFAVRSFGSL